jgi:hypothetical protein
MTEIITYVFEFLATFVSLWVGILLYRQKSTSQVPLGNNLLTIGALSLGFFTLSTIIYSLIGIAFYIILFLKLGMVAIMFGVLLLYYTMCVLVYSSSQFSFRKPYVYGPFMIFFIVSLILIFSDYIHVIDAITAETVFDLIPFMLYALFVSFMLLINAIFLFKYGIKKVNDASKTRMMTFLWSIIFFILSIISDAIGNFVEAEVVTDTLLFGFISIGVIFMAIAFSSKKIKE